MDPVTGSKRGAAQSMFYHADAFNRDVNGWDVSKVTNMQVSMHSVLSLHAFFSRLASAPACRQPGRVIAARPMCAYMLLRSCIDGRSCGVPRKGLPPGLCQH